VDNLFHFCLNAAYVETTSHDEQISRLFALSLGLFMAGMAVGPAVSSALPDPRLAFCLAAALLAIALAYIMSSLVPWPPGRDSSQSATGPGKAVQLRAGFATFFEPLAFFWHHPGTLLHGFALLAFTCGQAFFFPSLLIHASTNFGLNNRQIAGLVTLVCAASSLNLLLITFLPRLCESISCLASGHLRHLRRHISWDIFCACCSMLIFSMASAYLVTIWHSKLQLYVLAILCSLGNAAPALVKSHLTTRLPKQLQPPALAAVALCETIGSLLSPLVVGGAWARGLVGSDTLPIFSLVTASLVMAANVAFSIAAGCHFPAKHLAEDTNAEEQSSE
jgi:hypothetical protein